MTVLEGLAGLRQLPPGCIVSIGNFDGMHLGHRRLLQVAAQLKSAGNGSPIAVVTFEPHPLTVLRPELAPPRLTPAPRKQQLLTAAGVDALVVLPPSPEVLNLTAQQFWQILKDEVQPAHLVEGSSFFFGKGRGGSIQKLREWSVGTPIQLHVVEAVKAVLLDMTVVPVSSSLVRWLLEHGRVRDAAICLGRAYELEGRVVSGAKRGRSLGFPTANLDCTDQLIPADGIYAGRCPVDGRSFPVAISIGTNPTFGHNPRTVEPHLIGFGGNLYDRIIRVELIDWLRDQEIFETPDLLKARISQDIEEARECFVRDPARPIALLGSS